MPEHEAELLFSFDPATAAAIASSLSPETEAQPPKTSSTITSNDGALRVRVRADDLAALRAAVNSYARWVDAAERAARAGR